MDFEKEAREILQALRAGATDDDLELHIVELGKNAFLAGELSGREKAVGVADRRCAYVLADEIRALPIPKTSDVGMK
jgi:hypothetical protein